MDRAFSNRLQELRDLVEGNDKDPAGGSTVGIPPNNPGNTRVDIMPGPHYGIGGIRGMLAETPGFVRDNRQRQPCETKDCQMNSHLPFGCQVVR